MVGQSISHYKILEKLGEGGMGVVYKAHDTTLDRIVAIKFLPNYLTSDPTEKERFYHEARAAAALSHQNISVIYEISEHEGQVFLVMEFIEGKTLKKLIEQESDPLSIKKVLDIAIQTCEGLAAAHEKGIVHRDIKSDNIMLTTKGQVKIMDFGLAKVKGSTKLTKAGSTLGTAAYMSPEQAQGEDVDHRTDIFSFGVVLYELLTSKLPFRGEHQAALMYSLVNEEPQPIARFNENVPPDLERIVIKTLEKDRDERYQHIDDVLADLRRERKKLEYARTGYATTTTATISQPSMPVALPKRKITKYLIPAAVIVVLIIVLAVLNPFNFQIATQKSSASPEKSSLAVMYFENIPDPEDKDHTGEMLTNLLTTSLFQTKDVEVISRERLYDIQKELGQTDAKSISPSMATKIAQRAGVSMMLIGSILQKQPSLAITYRLVEVQTGKILSTQRLSDFPPEKIFSLVDTLALLAKKDLHVTPSGTAEEKSVASVTTTSPEAYRSYLEGKELNNRFYAAEAKAAFRRAIELDSNFAMAYFQLANVNLSNLSAAEFSSAMNKAYALRDRVTERERLSILSAYAGGIERNLPKAISYLEDLVEKYPHEQSAYIALGSFSQQIGQREKGAEIFLRGLQSDSLDKNLWNILAYAYASLNRKQPAMDAIERYLRLAPAEANPYDSKGDIYCLFADYDSAMVWWQKALSFRSDFPSAGKLFRAALVKQDEVAAEKYFHQFAVSFREEEKNFNEVWPVILPIQHGQLEQARKLLFEILASHKAQKLTDLILNDLDVLTLLDYEMSDYASMLKHAQERADELKKDPTDIIAGRPTVAIALLKNGAKKNSSALMDQLKSDLAKEAPVTQASYDYGVGICMFEEAQYQRALDQFNTALKPLSPNHAPLYHYAVCLLKSGRTEEAVHELQRLTQWIPVSNSAFDLDQLALSIYGLIAPTKAHYWLGVGYEELGRKQEAVREYEKFFEIWNKVDFKSKDVDDAQARLTKLKGMAAR